MSVLSLKRDRLRALEQLCRERALSLTIQRHTVFEVPLNGGGHPTADEVFADVQHRVPGVSRTTVYRVLDTLAQLGVLSKVYQPGAPAVFETAPHRHHHLACLSCNKIVDLQEQLSGIACFADCPLSRLRNHGSPCFPSGHVSRVPLQEINTARG